MQERWEMRVAQTVLDLQNSLSATNALQRELAEEKQRFLDLQTSLRNMQDAWNLERQRHLDQLEQLEREVQIRGEKVSIVEQEIQKIREDRSGLQVNEQVLNRQVTSYQEQLRRSVRKAEGLTSQLDEKEDQLREALRLKRLLHEAQHDKKQASAQRQVLQERLAMVTHELEQRHLEGDLELRRTRGALDESRKALRDMNFGPRLSVASDPRVPRLEKQLQSEQMKAAELTVQRESRDHKLKIVADNYQRERVRCEELSKQLVSDERRRLDVHEELGTVKAQLATRDRKVDTMRERMAMLAEEFMTRKIETNLQLARMQGQLQESRFLATKFGSPQKIDHSHRPIHPPPRTTFQAMDPRRPG